MYPNKDDFPEMDSLKNPILITIEDGNKVEAQGVVTVRVKLQTGE